MIKNLTLSVCTLFLVSTAARAQDIHFTLFDMAPLVFNPAESGAFSGTYRLSGIYRDQWLSVTGAPNEFKTPSVAVDVPVVKGFRDNDWVGVGVLLYSDNSGSLRLKQNAFKLSAAYHLALDKKGNSILSFGYQTGSIQRKIDVSGLDSTDPSNPDLLEDDFELNSQGELTKSFTDHVGGLHLKTRVNEGSMLQMGFSVGHIGSRKDIALVSPDTNSAGGGRFEVPMRFLGHGSWRTLMNDRTALVPSAFVQVQGKDMEIQAQVVAEYLFNPEKDVTLNGGLGYRVGDALQVLLGTRIRELTVMAAYDINLSALSPASSTIGGFEISAQVVGIIYKKPDPDPVLFCPRF